MSNTLNNTMDTAKDLMDSAKRETQHIASCARSNLVDGIHALSSVVSMMRALEVDDALGWVGLARRRGPLFSLALFSAGMMLGTGVGVLVAPESGERTRRALMLAFKRFSLKAEAEVKEIEQKAERLVDKVETKVAEEAGAAKDAIKTKAEETAFAVKETAKSAVTSMDPFCPTDTKPGERKTDKPAVTSMDPFCPTDTKPGEHKTDKPGESKTTRTPSSVGTHRMS